MVPARVGKVLKLSLVAAMFAPRVSRPPVVRVGLAVPPWLTKVIWLFS